MQRTGHIPGSAATFSAVATDTSANAGTASRIVAYPSRVLRPIPSFVFEAPTNWIIDEAPDAVAVVRTPQEVDGFWINALLSHDRVPKAVDLEEAAKVSYARLQQQSPEAKVTLERLARFGSNVVYLRGVEMKAPQSGRALAQLQALFFAPAEERAKTVDFFQFVATAPVESMAQVAPLFVEMISSFRFV
jgi:hypothetical protein